jgi:hypothetical protein
MPVSAIEKPTPRKCRNPGMRTLRAGAALILPALVLGAGLSQEHFPTKLNQFDGAYGLPG